MRGEGILRTVSAILAGALLWLLAGSVAARALPTVKFKGDAAAIPGFPHTGYILGRGSALHAEYRIEGTEYGGFPPPLTGIKYYAPGGAKLHPQGFVTCAPTVIEKSGPGPCPKQSIAGPKGSATGVVSFGGERVQKFVQGK